MSSGSSSEDSLVADTSVVGFVKASLKAKGKILEPSKAALEMAERKLQKWSEEEQEMLDDSLLDVVTDTPCPARTKSVVGEDLASGRSVFASFASSIALSSQACLCRFSFRDLNPLCRASRRRRVVHSGLHSSEMLHRKPSILVLDPPFLRNRLIHLQQHR